MFLKPKSEFSRNVLTLMTGTSIAQSIPIAISPILTRIYTPEDFGVFALYISIASLLSVMATGRYELAIMLPKKDEEASHLVVLSVFIAFLISLLSFAFICVFNPEITSILGNEEISSWLYLIPLSILLTGLYQSFNYWNNRQKRYKTLAISKVSQSSASGTTNLSLGFLSFGSSGLILGSLIGQAVGSFILIRLALLKEKKIFQNIQRLKLVALLKKYKSFPLINSLNAVIDQLRISGISILIAKVFSASYLGQFSLAWKMVQVPITLVSSSLSQVFYQKMSSIDKKDIYPLLNIYLKKAVLIGLPIFIGIYFFAVDIFSFVFGNNWILAGEIASFLSPWLFFNFLSSPMAHVFIVLNKQEVILRVSIVYMLIPLILLWLFNDLGFLTIISMISISMSLILIGFIYLALKYAKKETRNVVL